MGRSGSALSRFHSCWGGVLSLGGPTSSASSPSLLAIFAGLSCSLLAVSLTSALRFMFGSKLRDRSS